MKINLLKKLKLGRKDKLLGVSTKGDPETGLFEVGDILGAGTHFAELRRASTQGGPASGFYLTGMEVGDQFAVVTYTEENEDSADTGQIPSSDLLTADLIGNGIIVPPQSVVMVQYHQSFIPVLEPPENQPQPYVFSCRLNGVVQKSTIAGSVNGYRNGEQFYGQVTGNGVVINKTDEPQVLQLTVNTFPGFEAAAMGIAGGTFRAWHMGPYQGPLTDFEAPTGGFTYSPSSGRAPLEVTLASSATGDITTYVWDIEGAPTVFGSDPGYTVILPEGSHDITHYVIGPGGESPRVTETIIVDPALVIPSIAELSVSPTTGTQPLVANITFRVDGDAEFATLDFGDGTPAQQIPTGGQGQQHSIQHTYVSDADLTIFITATGEAGTSDPVGVSLTVTDPAEAPSLQDFTVTPTSGTNPLTVTAEVTVNGQATSMSFIWGDGQRTDVDTPGGGALISRTHILGAGSFGVSALATGIGGTNSTNPVSVAVAELAPTVDQFTASPVSGQFPQNVAVSFRVNNPANQVTLHWPDGAVTNFENVGGNGQVFTASRTFDQITSGNITVSGSGPGGALVPPSPIAVNVTGPVVLTGTVPFAVPNGAPYALVDEDLAALIPFSESDNLLNTDSLQVYDDQGTKLPCQFKVLSRSGLGKTRDSLDAPIRFVRALFPGSVPAATGVQLRNFGEAAFQLKLDESATLRGDMTLTDETTHFEITSGTSVFQVDKTTMTGFREVTVDGAVAISQAGSADVEFKDGVIVPGSVVTTIVDDGGYFIELLQRGRLKTTSFGEIDIQIRYQFHDGSNDVVVVPGIRQHNDWELGYSEERNEFLQEFYLSLPIANSGSVTVVSANGTTAVEGAETYRLHQRIRELGGFTKDNPDSRPYAPEGLPKGAEMNRTQRQITSYKEGKTSSMVDFPEQQYDAGIQVIGDAASISVGMEAFWEKAPSEYQVTDGKLRIGMFPSGVPGDTHFRGWPFRVDYLGRRRNGLLDEGNPDWLPVGDNPITGFPWANLDYAPIDFPNRHAPIAGQRPSSTGQAQGMVSQGVWKYTIRARYDSVNGQRGYSVTIPDGNTFNAYKPIYEAANPTSVLILESEEWTFQGKTGWVPDDTIDYYRLQPGMWFGNRLVVRFKAGTSQATAPELRSLQAKADNPAAGLSEPQRLVETDAFGGWKIFPTVTTVKDGNVATGHPDIDLYERWFDLVVDRFACDPQSGAGGTTQPQAGGRYAGYEAMRERGSSRPQGTIRRVLGWDHYGLAWWEGQFSSNNHYDQAGCIYTGFLKRRDPRFLKVGRPMALHHMNIGTIHGPYDEAAGRGEFVGSAYYEKATWIGHEQRHPFASHNWSKGLALQWLLYGDEDAKEAMEERAAYWTHQVHGRAPSSWYGRSGLRVVGWPIEGLTEIYIALGDIQGREGKRVMQEALDAIDHVMAMESNEMGLDKQLVANGGIPVNQVSADYSSTGQQEFYPNQGFVLNLIGDSANGAGLPRHFIQPWHHGIYLVAASRNLMTRPDVAPGSGAWVARFEHLGRVRDHLRSVTTYDPAQFATQFADIWFPDVYRIPDGLNLPAYIVTETRYSNYLPLGHLSDAFAYAYFLFKGTAQANSEDYTLAKHTFFAHNRYPLKIAGTGPTPNSVPPNFPIVPGENFGDPTSNEYDANGLPVRTPGTLNKIQTRHLRFSPGGPQVPKFLGEVFLRRGEGPAAAMAAEGEVAEMA